MSRTDEDDFPTGNKHAIPAAPLDGLEQLVLRLERAVANAELLFEHGGTLTRRVVALEDRVQELEDAAQ